jgi:AraC-like DNA-binding protein
MPKLREGFTGQKMIVIPKQIRKNIKSDPLLNTLFITDIGFYPKAKFHYRERKSGCSQHILIYCVEGAGWYELENQRYEVKPDEFFILPAGLPHKYSSNAEFPWNIYWIHFRGNMADRYIHSFLNTKKPIHHAVSHIDDRLQIFEEIYQTLEKGYSIENIGYASTCLWHFLGSFRFADAYTHTKAGGAKTAVETSIQFMKEHLHEPLGLDDLAKSARYSASYYSLLFKKKTGYAPIEYFIHLKIQRACQYLDLTDLYIQEIARKVGYEDPYYFSRIFKNVMGSSPSEYRKKEKG